MPGSKIFRRFYSKKEIIKEKRENPMSKIKFKSFLFYEFYKIVIHVIIFAKSSEWVNSFCQSVVLATPMFHFKSSTIIQMIVFLKNLSKYRLIQGTNKKSNYQSELMD